MACDVVGALDDAVAKTEHDETKLLRVLTGRVGAWQEFMRKGTQVLSPEAEIGLIGELMLLRAIIDAGSFLGSRRRSWVGPLDGIQDFELGTGALEVKATLSAAFTGVVHSNSLTTRRANLSLWPALDYGKPTAGKICRQSSTPCVDDKGRAEAERLLAERLLAAGLHRRSCQSLSTAV